MKIQDYLQHISNFAANNVSNNKDKEIQIIEGIGEVEINGVNYQVQILLEPKEKNFVITDGVTIRKTI